MSSSKKSDSGFGAFIEALKQRTVYGNARLAVVIVYASLVVTTIVLAAPADEKTNQVGARIMALEGDMVVGRYFIVQNESRDHWYDVVFEIDGGYQVRRELVHAGEKVTLFLKDFQKDDPAKRGKRISAPVEMQVQYFTVRTRYGAARAEVEVSR